MIAIDLEMSGMDEINCGIIEIGAIEIENTSNTFHVNCRLEDNEKVINLPNLPKTVEETVGLTEEQMKDLSRTSQKEALEKFIEWLKTCNDNIFVCQNFKDISFLTEKCKKYGLKFPGYRFFDHHSLAHTIYYQVNKEFKIKNKISEMGLTNIQKFCGIEDTRTIHDALGDAKIVVECFSRLVYKKPALKEFSKFEIPEYLK